jgi:DNA-binding PadR family transcriptional regulator
MKSPISWALLGLVIERPSYAYELSQRFARTYQDALSLSSSSHIYTALAPLQARGLIEEVAGVCGGRQPKPRYQATSEGVASYCQRLVEQAREDRRRQRLFVLQLAALTRRPDAALDVLERYEQAWLDEAHQISIHCEEGDHDLSASWVAGLLSEESRLLTGGKLSWVGYARRTLKDLVNTQSRR